MIHITTLLTLQAKHNRACDKHDWTGYTLADMNAAAAGEQLEIDQAEERGQIHGPHGVIDETYDLIAVLLRKVEALERTPHASNKKPAV